jgi:hypothetical protein
MGKKSAGADETKSSSDGRLLRYSRGFVPQSGVGYSLTSERLARCSMKTLAGSSWPRRSIMPVGMPSNSWMLGMRGIECSDDMDTPPSIADGVGCTVNDRFIEGVMGDRWGLRVMLAAVDCRLTPGNFVYRDC